MTIPQTWFAVRTHKHASTNKLQMRVFYSLFMKYTSINAIRNMFMAREIPSMYIKFSNQSISTTPFLRKDFVVIKVANHI